MSRLTHINQKLVVL